MALLHDSRNPVAPANYFDWKRQSTVFSAVGRGANIGSANVGGDVPERVQGLSVTSDILAMTGVRPLLGRLLRPRTMLPSAECRSCSSWGFWQTPAWRAHREFSASASPIDGASYTVVGVMPRGFDFPMFWATGVQLWAPLPFGERATSRRGRASGSSRVSRPG